MQLNEGLTAHLARRVRGLSRRPGVLALCVIACAAVIVVAVIGVNAADDGRIVIERDAGAAHADMGESDAGDVDIEPSDAEEPEELIVDVGGAVKVPGVVSLAAGSRVADAIAAAGGLADDADVSSVNQAAPVADGQKVTVPRVGEAPVETAVATGSGSSSPAAGGLVNINSATVEQLDELPGVGPSTAQAIIEDREKNGLFSSVEDLMRVSGIGEKKFEKLKDAICI